ncbi:MAG: hypothetical protein AB7Q42_09705 [Acidimicrobiia bacterium]
MSVINRSIPFALQYRRTITFARRTARSVLACPGGPSASPSGSRLQRGPVELGGRLGRKVITDSRASG